MPQGVVVASRIATTNLLYALQAVAAGAAGSAAGHGHQQGFPGAGAGEAHHSNLVALPVATVKRTSCAWCRQWRAVLRELRPDTDTGKGSLAPALVKHYRRLLLALEADLIASSGAQVRSVGPAELSCCSSASAAAPRPLVL